MISSKMKVVLPSSLENFFQESGYCNPTFFEDRSSARIKLRCEATMIIEQGLASISRVESNYVVLIKDISRRGVSILSHEQIWPEELIYVHFQNRELRAKVVRCRRLGPSCYECGAQIFYFKKIDSNFGE